MEVNTSSRSVAKQRLQKVLVHDRARLSPELMAMLKQALIAAAQDYLEVDANEVEINLEIGNQAAILNVKIPVISIVRERET